MENNEWADSLGDGVEVKRALRISTSSLFEAVSNFTQEDIVEHTTSTRLGEVYSEILFYDDIASRASARLDVYQNKLGLKLGK